MKLDALLKKEGMAPVTRAAPATAKQTNLAHSRERPWLHFNEDVSPVTEQHREQSTVKQALDSRESGVSSTLENPTSSRESGVSSALDENQSKTQPVRKALGTALDSRESGIRKNEISALDVTLLVGNEKNLVFLACEECRKIGSLETNYIPSDEIKIKLSIDSNGLRNLIHRVKNKGYFDVEAKQLGRKGLRKFKISQSIYQQFSSSALDSRESGVRSALAQALGTALETPPIVVVPNLNSSNTTNTQNADEPCFVIPNELSGKVSRRQLSEFVLSGKISESDLQLSLDAFAYDLKNKLVSSKYSSNPVSLLIGAIKNNGSYNSAKYIEVLKSELKPFIQTQREISAEKSDLKNSAEWGSFQKFKAESPDAYQALGNKISQYGFTGEMLEDFLFLEFKKTILKSEPEANLNPLRPHEARTP